MRGSWDFALSEVAVSRGPDGQTRMAVGGVAPYPLRATAAEEVLAGQPLTEAIIARAADAVLAKARPLAMNGYKVDLTRALLRRALGAVA